MPQPTILANTPASVPLQIAIHVSLGVFLIPKTSSSAHTIQPIILVGALVITLTPETFFFANLPQLTISASAPASVLLQILIHAFPGIFLALETSFFAYAPQLITPAGASVSILTLENLFFPNMFQQNTSVNAPASVSLQILLHTFLSILLAPKTSLLAHAPQLIIPAGIVVSILHLKTFFFANATESTTLAVTLASFLPKIQPQISLAIFPGVFPVTLRPTSIINNLSLMRTPLHTVSLNVQQK